jgi:hypothetical protein
MFRKSVPDEWQDPHTQDMVADPAFKTARRQAIVCDAHKARRYESELSNNPCQYSDQKHERRVEKANVRNSSQPKKRAAIGNCFIALRS